MRKPIVFVLVMALVVAMTAGVAQANPSSRSRPSNHPPDADKETGALRGSGFFVTSNTGSGLYGLYNQKIWCHSSISQTSMTYESVARNVEA